MSQNTEGLSKLRQDGGKGSTSQWLPYRTKGVQIAPREIDVQGIDEYHGLVKLWNRKGGQERVLIGTDASGIMRTSFIGNLLKVLKAVKTHVHVKPNDALAQLYLNSISLFEQEEVGEEVQNS